MQHFVVWQRAEGLVVFLAGIALFWQLDPAIGWWAVLVFFAPDLSFFGYSLGPKIGGVIYNLVHVYAAGLVLMAIGTILAQPLLAALGALWLAHCGFDRLMGYGLKSADSFSETHLGRIGKGR